MHCLRTLTALQYAAAVKEYTEAHQDGARELGNRIAAALLRDGRAERARGIYREAPAPVEDR